VPTLGDRLRRADQRRFIGRERELALFDEALSDDPPHRVLLVHAAGGMGKSTLLREVARRGAARGFEVFEVDGRALNPVPGDLEEALDGAFDAERPLILLDTWERMSAANAHLRSRLLPALPGDAVVVIAGRDRPDADWFQDGWERLVTELPLRPMAETEASALVRDHGAGEDVVSEIVSWASGSPLALALAADASHADPAWRVERAEDDQQLMYALLRRVAQTEVDGGNLDVAAVAAIARTSTRALLAEVLPDVDAEQAEGWLRSLSFAELVGEGIALHDVARRALRGEISARAPERARELRRRVAEHLYARAAAGRPELMVDLAELVDAPAVRWGFGAEGSVDLRVDELHPGDADELEREIESRANSEWFALARPYFEEAPRRVVVVRDAHDKIAGFSIAMTPGTAPALAADDPVMGPWLAHAREHVPDGNALMWRDSVDLTAGSEGDPGSAVLALMNTAAMMRSGLASPRYLYLPIDPANAPAVAFSEGIGARHVPELDFEIVGKQQQCHVFDAGPSGLLGALRAAIYAELGMEIPAGDAPAPSLSSEVVRDALRNLHKPTELAASPLATGADPEARAASVRALLAEAAASAFGDSPDEQLHRSVIERGYLDPGSTHESVAHDLHLSRAAYFRRLRQASDRIADWVLAHRTGA